MKKCNSDIKAEGALDFNFQGTLSFLRLAKSASTNNSRQVGCLDTATISAFVNCGKL